MDYEIQSVHVQLMNNQVQYIGNKSKMSCIPRSRRINGKNKDQIDKILVM